MFEWLKEYLRSGISRPLGTIMMMERAYFVFRRKFPAKEEYAYLRLALQSRYREKSTDEICSLLSECKSLDDVIVKALQLDFGPAIALRTEMDVLWKSSACSCCGKYRALTAIDKRCYGCRKYFGFGACTQCHLYWDDLSIDKCSQCGQKLWRITDGPGVPLLYPAYDGSSPTKETLSMLDEVVSEEKETKEQEGDDFAKLMAEAEVLEGRCERSYNSDATHRRQYRELRRRDPELARQWLNDIESYPEPDRTLNSDLDCFCNAICSIYLSSLHRGAEIRALLGANKRLLQELYYYAIRRVTEFGNTGNKDTLLCGIAAASIDNGRGIRDFDDPLGRLYRAAQERGLDPSFFFFLVACCSEKDTRYKLENFVQSEYFIRFVKPHLRGN
ncbi:MAG: hypothetical protein HY204_00530 [Nitrospirae bacterium]|nr:hypothetical protein [Nitrospirota bacterium]